MRYVLLLLIGLTATAAEAKVCVDDNAASCKDLGYTKSSCEYGGIACPYNTNLWYCTPWTCEDGRYSSTKDTSANVNCVAATYKGLECWDCETIETGTAQ